MLGFLIEVSLSLTVSIFALVVLKEALQNILTDLCEESHRAEFWTRFTLLMLIIGPLLGTFLLSPYNSNFGNLEANHLREILRHVLTGVFATLSGIGFIIWSSIRNRVISSRPTFENRMPMSDRDL